MDIGSLLNQAGGASAIAREIGVDESTVASGAGALLPHVVNGIEKQGVPGEIAAGQAVDPQTADPGQGGLLGGLIGGASGGGILGSLVGGGVGNEILGHIFGSKDASRDVAAQASQQSGVDTSVLKKLLPIVAGAVAMHDISRRGRSTGEGSDRAGSGGLLGSILGGL